MLNAPKPVIDELNELLEDNMTKYRPFGLVRYIMEYIVDAPSCELSKWVSSDMRQVKLLHYLLNLKNDLYDGEVITAPQEVIVELDYHMDEFEPEFICNLYGKHSLLDRNSSHSVIQYKNTHEYVYECGNKELSIVRERAVVNHVLGLERIHPERDKHYYVSTWLEDGTSKFDYILNDMDELEKVYSTPEYAKTRMNLETATAIAKAVKGDVEVIE